MPFPHTVLEELAEAIRAMLHTPDDGKRRIRRTSPTGAVLFATQQEHIRQLLLDLDYEPRRHGSATHCNECGHDHENCMQVIEPGQQPGFPDGEWMCRFCLDADYSADPFPRRS